MNRLERETIVNRENLEQWFKNTLEQLNADVYDYSAQAAKAVLGEEDPELGRLRREIESVLIFALFQDCDPVEELLESVK